MALVVDDHPNIVQQTQILIILAYVGIIVLNSWFGGPPCCLVGFHLFIDPLWWFSNSFVEVTLGFVTPICTSVPSLAILSLTPQKLCK